MCVFHGCITFWYETFKYYVLGTLILPIKGWDAIFFYFLGEKSPARVAKVPAAILNPELYYDVEDYSKFCVKLNLFGSAFLYSCWSCSFQGRKTKLSSFDVEKTYYNKDVTRLNLSFFRHYRRNSEKFLSTPKVDTLWRGENTFGGLATRLSKTGRGLLDNKGFFSSS